MDIRGLDDHQLDLLKQFRENVHDCRLPYSCDAYLLRWLIARDLDLVKAEKMLRNSLEWRRDFGINDPRWKAPEVAIKYYPISMAGLDKRNNTLWIMAYGRIDLKGMMESLKKKDVVKYVVRKVEDSLVDLYRRAKATEMLQMSIILDLEYLAMGHLTNKPGLDAFLDVVKYYEANYPELLYRVYVINAPRIFPLGWALVRPFLHEKTANKIRVYGTDREQWKAAILEDVDPSQLPVFYGGSKTDPDGNPQCLTNICMGGEIPKSYYLTNRKPNFDSFEKNISVSNGCKEQFEYEIQEAGSILRWQFCSEDGDIAFSIVHKRENGTNEILPRQRINCHVSIEEGHVYCINAGKYVVEFDNTYSYLRSKRIWFTITVSAQNVNIQ